MPEDIITPENFAARTAPYMARLTHCYGAIVMLKENGQCESKGSMVLVKAAAQHFIFTARHVADEVRTKSGYVFIRPAITEEESLRGHFTEVVRFPLSEADIAWASDDIDVAAFRAPRGLVELEYLRWFDATACSTAATNVRKHSGERPLLTVIMGCPNYGHFRDGHRETLSFLPMQTYISSFERQPWDGVSGTPQIHLEVDDGSHREQEIQGAFRRRIWESLRGMAGTEQVALGGYSGAPLVVLGSDDEFLIGVVTEGDYMFGSPRVLAVAWDDIMTAFERSFGTSPENPAQG